MWNKTLAALRSLGERGFYVAVGEKTRFSTALFSKYASKTLVYPSPASSPKEFISWLLGELKHGNYDMVLPTEFTTQQLIAGHRAEITRLTGFPFPDLELTAFVNDKAKLMRFARERGYPVPETFFTCEQNHIEDIADSVPYPAVIKPRESSGSRGLEYVEDREGLIEKYRAVHKTYPFPIIQERIPGSPGGGFGVGALFNFENKPRAAFVYQRLREYPVSGGPSTLRQSVVNDEIKDIALSLLTELKWTGPAMVEFKIDPRDGRPRLLEINPRLWGSLELAIRSGVDFPYLLYKLHTEGDIKPVVDYRVGYKCRWLIPGDILHVLTNPNKLKALGQVLRKTDGDDILSFSDPMPVIGRISSLLPMLYNKDMRRLVKR